jgi:hypothetical protein
MYPEAHEEFGRQMKAMRANYGEDKLPDAKCALIWGELKEFSPKQIKSICSRILAEQQFAPVLMHFQDKASALREKIRQWEREQERIDADRFYNNNPTILKP